jgi:hypothetical protein
MAVSLTKYMNSKLKAMGKTATQAKKNAGKYKSIAAAKKAGALYYTDKSGKVMAAVYAEDLKKPLGAIKPPKKPTKKPKPLQGPTRLGTMTLQEKAEVDKLNKQKRMTGMEITDSVLNATKKPKGQSAAFNAFFKKNKAKYEKDNGGFNTRQALKDFNARSK